MSDDPLGHALTHPLRLDILRMLSEGELAPSEIAAVLGLDVSLVGNHMRTLRERDCIEMARTPRVRNFIKHYYRLAKLPLVSDGSDYRSMSARARRRVVRLTIQAIAVELMNSFRLRVLEDEEDGMRCVLDCVELDEMGRQELAMELEAGQARICEIRDSSADRLRASPETGTAMVLASMAFRRSRPVERPGQRVGLKHKEA
jgi:DNA-binding transcriptional ArsR family regulator